MKIVTMYLPQYHRIPENDEWWGEGFTEWTTVSKGEALFEGHTQPRIPLKQNYYNLLSRKTMEWQSKLMQEYGVSGQCFYHYWFGNGRTILERPAENLLEWKDINMPFCFSWDSGSWVRTWSGLYNQNMWTRKFEKEKKDENDNGILLEQNYGQADEWKRHFQYLLPFFKDDRYIRIDGKPVFIFYRPDEIYCISEMVECWRQLASKNNLPGLYIIGTNCEAKNVLDALYMQAPRPAFEKTIFELNNYVKCYDTEDVWNTIHEEIMNKEMKTYWGGVVGYDDTPRKGSAGLVMINNSPEKFEGNLKKLIKKNECFGNDIVFLNAWNEWSEGAYLEPDSMHGTAYLEAVKKALNNYKNISLDITDSKSNRDNNQLIVLNNRYKSYWVILNKWMKCKEDGICLENYFIKRNWSNIAIYGLGMLGRHLISELKNSKVEVKYGIDVHNDIIVADIPVVNIGMHFENVDVIVVTPTYDYENIVTQLKKNTDIRTISLMELFE